MKILETTRLILRTVNHEDIPQLYKKIFSDIEVIKLTFGNELFNLEECTKFIKENCNFDKEIGLSAIIEKQTNTLIGLGGVLQCEYLNQKDYEIGFILAKEFWGKGYATEIGQAQIDYVKNKIKASRVIALVDSSNTSSINAIKKLNLSYFTKVKTKDSRGDREVYILNF
ncbi:hypothetical protein CRU99_13560 [Malaciobacter mytili]|uniref:GNAT family N-acetyltransferase n=1 Tax=Malaciobacter mytili TaxID=603050 RepID=UPI00100B2B68|nr:GNAT family N-acetyltransferase [Malaciobacter mytili]RXI36186.1 hypothetical protein CRU99_13560 [Malaciobacter mytili]